MSRTLQDYVQVQAGEENKVTEFPATVGMSDEEEVRRYAMAMGFGEVSDEEYDSDRELLRGDGL